MNLTLRLNFCALQHNNVNNKLLPGFVVGPAVAASTPAPLLSLFNARRVSCWLRCRSLRITSFTWSIKQYMWRKVCNGSVKNDRCWRNTDSGQQGKNIQQMWRKHKTHTNQHKHIPPAELQERIVRSRCAGLESSQPDFSFVLAPCSWSGLTAADLRRKITRQSLKNIKLFINWHREHISHGTGDPRYDFL